MGLKELQKNLDKKRVTVEALKDEMLRISSRERLLGIELEELSARKHQIKPLYFGGGELRTSEKEVTQAVIAVSDYSKPSPVWLKPPSYWGYRNMEYVVSRVTPKRIYVRKRNHPSTKETYYDKITGKGTGELDGIIDVSATLPSK